MEYLSVLDVRRREVAAIVDELFPRRSTFDTKGTENRGSQII